MKVGVAVDRCSGLSAGLRAGASLAQRLQRVPQVQSALHWHSVYSVYPKYSLLFTGTASTACTPSTVRSSLAQRLQRVSQVQSALHGHAQSQGVAAHGAGEISAQLFTTLLKVY